METRAQTGFSLLFVGAFLVMVGINIATDELKLQIPQAYSLAAIGLTVVGYFGLLLSLLQHPCDR